MPLKYSWKLTVIAGKEQPYDYCCQDGEQDIGRVYRHHSGRWLWSMTAFGQGINRGGRVLDGQADTKDEAAAIVEQWYEACRH